MYLCVMQSSTEAVSSTSQDGSIKPPTVVRQAVIPPAHKLSLNNLAKSNAHTAHDKVMVLFCFLSFYGVGLVVIYSLKAYSLVNRTGSP